MNWDEASFALTASPFFVPANAIDSNTVDQLHLRNSISALKFGMQNAGCLLALHPASAATLLHCSSFEIPPVLSVTNDTNGRSLNAMRHENGLHAIQTSVAGSMRAKENRQ